MSFEPYVISWNLTKRCNLRCAHCYLDATFRDHGAPAELTPEECLKTVDDLAEVNPQAVLILTGGEPLLRPDIFSLSRYAADKGFMVVLGTNGISISDSVARKLVDARVSGVGVSIDSLKPENHDNFRGLPGAWERSLKGIEALKRVGLPFQISTSITTWNLKEIGEIADFASNLGASVFNVFFLVCTGRGQDLTDITPEQYEETLKFIYSIQGKYPTMMVRPKCAPHFKRIVHEADPESPILKGYVAACRAGTNYFRITPEGDVTPCPYMPTKVGNVREKSFKVIWETSSVFQQLRKPVYEGKCETCKYKLICGGCRARALASKGDMLNEDPWCVYEPEAGQKPLVNIETAVKFGLDEDAADPNWQQVRWEPEAESMLDKIPFFVRPIVQKYTEAYVRKNGIPVITMELMRELKEKRMGNMPNPNFLSKVSPPKFPISDMGDKTSLSPS